MRRRLLVDADWLCFSLACAFQKINPFNPEDIEFDGKLAKSILDQKIRKAVDELEIDKVVMYFSCDRTSNWRRTLVESYKKNRKGKLSPIGLMPLKDYCKGSYDCVEEPTLEADDLIGLDATGKYAGNNVIYSVDKDFLTIPTVTFNPNKRTTKTQSRVDAFKFFIYQVIIGDSSDGYKGINKVGPVGAKRFLNRHKKALFGIWAPLVELAEKQGHNEDYLLSQARMAHILQDGDFDFKTKEIRLWQPEMINKAI
jgi:DNA polymerase-1